MLRYLKIKLRMSLDKLLVTLGFPDSNELYYVNGSENLPAPLSAVKEREILDEIMNGDESKR